MSTEDELRRVLVRIDGRGYKAYGDLRGDYALGSLSLFIDHVQGDPFAAPSKLRLRVPMTTAALPAELRRDGIRRTALADFLARELREAITARAHRRSRTTPIAGGNRHPRQYDRAGHPGSGKSGMIFIDAGGQEVLERTAVLITDHYVEARIEVGLPAAGRRVLGREAETLLLERLPELAERGLCWRNLDSNDARDHVLCVENQERIRAALQDRGLIAFVADGAILPRESGASDRPLCADRTYPFVSPESLRVEMPLENPIDGPDGQTRVITGMGIRAGVTLIVGGGYHGKSTLLRALECCVYPHIPGDGREYVVAASDLVKIRAEDGRSISGVDIHTFIDRLPQTPGAEGNRDADSTRHFSSSNASGSTSQAASIIEAIEVGARGLLLDEDTSASNFMLRDARMQQLVHKEHEPITPFVDRVRELYDMAGVSTVLVMGGSGDYFEKADTVIMMRSYVPENATEEAHSIAERVPTGRTIECVPPLDSGVPRIPLASSFSASRGRRDVKIATKSRELIHYGRELIDLRHISQLVDTSQTRAVAMAIHLASRRFMARKPDEATAHDSTLAEVLDQIERLFDEEGLSALDPYRLGQSDERHPGSFARPRRYEIAAAINRMRGLRVELQTHRVTR